MSRVRVMVPPSGVAALNVPGGIVYEGMRRAAMQVRDLTIEEITALNAIDSGRMRQAVAWELRSNGPMGVTAFVGVDIAKLPGSTDYPFIVHEGRGPVFPRRARVLRFKPKGGGAFIFRPSVGPAQAKPFLTRALRRFRFTT